MEGLPQNPKHFRELMKDWNGFTSTGEDADEESYEHERFTKLKNPKNYLETLNLRPFGLPF
jgi:hypothetical protein